MKKSRPPKHPVLRSRRDAVLGLAGLVAGAALLGSVGGCGFELRRAPTLRFRTIQLAGFPSRSPLGDQLRASIDASTTTHVVDSLAQAQVVLEVLLDARERSVVASGAAGQVTEFQLRERFSYRLGAVDGRVLIPTTELLLTRDMSYTESAALGKEQEEAFLYRAMQNDIVTQVLRRLASVASP